jgi:hypothetical protein
MQATPGLKLSGATISDSLTSAGVTAEPFQPMRTSAVTARARLSSPIFW